MTDERKLRAERAEQMRKQRESADKRQRNLITVGIVAVVIALIAAAAFAIAQTSKDREQEDDVITPKGSTAEHGIVYTPADAGYTGEAKDPVKVVLYEDFQCPICQQFEIANGQYLNDQVAAGTIELEYRLVAFLDDTGASPNEYSRRAASASLCVRDAGGMTEWKQMHDILYANQPQEGSAGPENNDLFETAKSVFDKTSEKCVVQGRYVPWIAQGADEMEKAGFRVATPTVVIDGKQFEQALDATALRTAIEKAVAAKK